MTPEEIWQRKSAEELLAASTRPGEYTEIGQQIIRAEIQRRRALGLMTDDQTEASGAPESTTPPAQFDLTSSGYVGRLWRGEVSLSVTYWVWGVLVNILTRALIVFAVLVTHARSVVLGLGLLYIVYGLFMFVAIWRSAGRYGGRRIWADLARVSLVLVIVVRVAIVLLGE